MKQRIITGIKLFVIVNWEQLNKSDCSCVLFILFAGKLLSVGYPPRYPEWDVFFSNSQADGHAQIVLHGLCDVIFEKKDKHDAVKSCFHNHTWNTSCTGRCRKTSCKTSVCVGTEPTILFDEQFSYIGYMHRQILAKVHCMTCIWICPNIMGINSHAFYQSHKNAFLSNQDYFNHAQACSTMLTIFFLVSLQYWSDVP